MNTAFLANNPDTVRHVYGRGGASGSRRSAICWTPSSPKATSTSTPPSLAQVEAVFSTWSMFNLPPQRLDLMPRLRAVFYAAGSVRHLRPTCWTATSPWSAPGAIALSVAEFAVSQIMLAGKGYWRNMPRLPPPRRPGGRQTVRRQRELRPHRRDSRRGAGRAAGDGACCGISGSTWPSTTRSFPLSRRRRGRERSRSPRHSRRATS